MTDIRTYSGLQTGALRWLRRSNDTFTEADVPMLIALAEARINRDLRISLMESTATLTIDSATEALPSDFQEVRALVLQTTPKVVLGLKTPQDLYTTYANGVAGQPQHYSIIGSNLRTGPSPDASYTAELIYYAKIPALSDSNTTTTVLTAHPDIYLYATLIEGAVYLKNDARLATWADLYQRAIGNVSASDQSARWGGGSLTVQAEFVA